MVEMFSELPRPLRPCCRVPPVLLLPPDILRRGPSCRSVLWTSLAQFFVRFKNLQVRKTCEKMRGRWTSHEILFNLKYSIISKLMCLHLTHGLFEILGTFYLNSVMVKKHSIGSLNSFTFVSHGL